MKIIINIFCFFLIFISSICSAKQNLQKYVIGCWPAGIGAVFHQMLTSIYYCDKTNQIPVIFWEKDSLYYTPKGFNNEKNVWNYYFEPISSLSYKKGDKIHRLPPIGIDFHFDYHKLSEEYRMKAYEIIKKYIRPNFVVQSKIDHFYDKHLANKKTIGIHLRGTDKIKEEKPVLPSKMVEEALKYANSDTQFFIATDEKKILDELIVLLSGRNVVYYDCARSKNGAPLHIDCKDKSRYPIAQNGEDVVVEMMLLSKCNILLHTLSNVSAIPLYFNPYLEHVTLK